MDTYKLQYFIAAAQSLNFSEVARAHFISQPAVSHQISLLEEELGVPLFARVGRQLILTSEGELFLPEAIKILQSMQDSIQLVQRQYLGNSGRVSVVVANSNSAVYTNCLEVFYKRYPYIFVDTTVALGSEQVNAINKGGFDICFVAEYLLINNPNYDYTVTFKDRLCLAIPKSISPICDTSDFSIFNEYPFISISMESASILYNDIRQVCKQRNYEPYPINQYNRIEAVLWSVAAGVGISVVPMSTTVLFATDNIEFIPIDGDDCMVNCVAGWKRVTGNKAAELFKEVIVEQYT